MRIWFMRIFARPKKTHKPRTRCSQIHKVEKWFFFGKFPRKNFFVISHEYKDRFFLVIRPKKILDKSNISPESIHFSQKLKDPKHKIPKNHWEKWKILSNFRRKDFFVISHGHKGRFFVVIRPKKIPGHIKYWARINLFISKNQNFDPKHKIPNNQWEKLNGFHYLKFQNFDFLKVPYFCRIDSGTIFYMSGSFFGPNHYKKPVFMSMRNYKEILPSEVAWIFLFFNLMDLTIWDFWQTPIGVRWGQKLNGTPTGTYTDGLDNKKSNSGKSLGNLRL